MKYDYSVKVNGKWYTPGEEVPEKVTNIAKESTADILAATETNETEKKPGKKKN